MQQRDTSWQKVGKWYSKITESGGHYYHTHVVLPGVVRLLDLTPQSRLLDIACGTGVLGMAIPPITEYLGIDKAPKLIEEAKKRDQKSNHKYVVADMTEPYHFATTYTHAAIVLALQNMEQPEGAIKNASSALDPGGKLVIVLNHPMFRIPRQSGWGIDEKNKTQYRKVTKYMSIMEIPITAHPGQKGSVVTWSYHHPLADYSAMLYKNGFVIEQIEEWVSDKTSVGKAGKQENRSRAEIPLFLTIQAKLGI